MPDYKIPKTIFEFADVIDEAGNRLDRVVKSTTQVWLEPTSSKSAVIVVGKAAKQSLRRLSPLARLIDSFDLGKYFGEKLAELLAPLYVPEDDIVVIYPPQGGGDPELQISGSWVTDNTIQCNPGQQPVDYYAPGTGDPDFLWPCSVLISPAEEGQVLYEPLGDIWYTFGRDGKFDPSPSVSGSHVSEWVMDLTWDNAANPATEEEVKSHLVVVYGNSPVVPVVPAQPNIDPIAPYIPDVAPIISVNVNWRPAPVFMPANLPINPVLPITQQPVRSYTGNQLDDPAPPILAPDEVPLEVPTVVVYPSTFPPPRAGDGANTRVHRRIPKGQKRQPGVKERKVRLPKAYTVLNKGLHLTTEALDIVDILYDALPDEFKPAYREYQYWDKKQRKMVKVRYVRAKNSLSPQQKLEAIYNGYEHMDLEAVAYGLTDNYLEDAFYGTLGSGVAGNNRLFGDLGGPRTFGMQRGAAQRRYGTLQARSVAARTSREQKRLTRLDRYNRAKARST